MTINALFILISVFLFVFAAFGLFPAYHLVEWGLASFSVGHLPLASFTTTNQS